MLTLFIMGSNSFSSLPRYLQGTQKEPIYTPKSGPNLVQPSQPRPGVTAEQRSLPIFQLHHVVTVLRPSMDGIGFLRAFAVDTRGAP